MKAEKLAILGPWQGFSDKCLYQNSLVLAYNLYEWSLQQWLISAGPLERWHSAKSFKVFPDEFKYRCPIIQSSKANHIREGNHRKLFWMNKAGLRKGKKCSAQSLTSPTAVPWDWTLWGVLCPSLNFIPQLRSVLAKFHTLTFSNLLWAERITPSPL